MLEEGYFCGWTAHLITVLLFDYFVPFVSIHSRDSAIFSMMIYVYGLHNKDGCMSFLCVFNFNAITCCGSCWSSLCCWDTLWSPTILGSWRDVPITSWSRYIPRWWRSGAGKQRRFWTAAACRDVVENLQDKHKVQERSRQALPQPQHELVRLYYWLVGGLHTVADKLCSYGSLLQCLYKGNPLLVTWSVWRYRKNWRHMRVNVHPLKRLCWMKAPRQQQKRPETFCIIVLVYFCWCYGNDFCHWCCSNIAALYMYIGAYAQ